jgi:dihydrolipoamide dehydrogenase
MDWQYDMITLGGGPGGGAAARQVARRGGRACIVEASRLGGVCLNVGCIPTKAMLAASDLAWRMRRAGRFGIAPVAPEVDGPAFMGRVAGVVAELAGRSEAAVHANKQIDLVRGRGRLVDAHTVVVDTPEGPRLISGRAVVIATGSSAARPGFLPWDSPHLGGLDGRLMTTDEAVTASDLPASIIVMGGGVIGCEMATVYSELGIATTVIEMLPHLLPGMDEEAGQAAAASLTERGATILTGRKVLSMSDAGDGARPSGRQVVARLDDGAEVRAAAALVAVGRRPNVEDIGLEQVGVRLAGGIIPVDDRCRTNVEGVYAVGDVAERRQYAHLAERMGVVAGENVMGVDLADDRAVVPVGAYTHPEAASVGLTLAEAKAISPSARAFRYSYAHAGMALASGETHGHVKIVADADSGRIHGALWIGPHAIDMIQEAALAMRHGLTISQLYHTIHAHPTFQEAAMLAAEGWVAQSIRKRR